MQEIKKRIIAIASVLKPVDDVRMFGKIAQSLVKMPDAQIHVFGYATQSPTRHERITTHPSKPFNRLSAYRLLHPYILLLKLIRLKPESLIITTHELLLTAAIVRMVVGCKIYYDIQENYYRNIAYSNVYPAVVRWLLAIYVRTTEKFFAPCIKLFILAEKGYTHELSFIGDKFIIAENKFKTSLSVTQRQRHASNFIRLIFSGTLSSDTGVFEAIALAKELHRLNQNIRLTIIGYCPIASTYDRILTDIIKHPYINLIGGNKIVPHNDIVNQIIQADVGLITYPITKITSNRVPTKLFEYLASGLHILIPNHPPWTSRCVSKSCITFNQTFPDYTAILNQILTRSPYETGNADIFWDDATILSTFAK